MSEAEQDIAQRHRGRAGSDSLTGRAAEMEMLGLFDGTTDPAFEATVRIIRRVFDVPVALVSIIDEDGDRQLFKSQVGLPEPWADIGQTRLSHSFCRIVQLENRPLIVDNAPSDARVCDNGAVEDLNVLAYLGVPVHGPDDRAIGALAAISSTPREWHARELELLGDLATICDERIRLIQALPGSDYTSFQKQAKGSI